MNPEPAPAGNPPGSNTDEFLIVVAIGNLHEFVELFPFVLGELLADKPHRIEVVENTLIPDLAKMPLVRSASVVIIFTSVWASQSNEPGDANVASGVVTIRNVHRLRKATAATLVWTTSFTQHYSLDDIRDAGADLALLAPFEFPELNNVVLAAYFLWCSSRNPQASPAAVGPAELPSGAAQPEGSKFRVLIACARERFIADAFAEGIQLEFPQAPLEFSFPDSYHVQEIAVSPEARNSDLMVIFLSNLVGKIPDDEKTRRTLAWHARRIRILRNTCPGYLIAMSSQLPPSEFPAMKSAGVDLMLPAPCRMREMFPGIEQAYRRWLESRGRKP